MLYDSNNKILYNFDNIQVSSNHSIELIPVLIAANHQMELPEINTAVCKHTKSDRLQIVECLPDVLYDVSKHIMRGARWLDMR